MRSFVFLSFVFSFVNSNVYNRRHDLCESNEDCFNVTHCCRGFHTKSKLSCRNVPSCFGRYCKADRECGGLCCSSSKCTKCSKCISSDECKGLEVCCGGADRDRECQDACLGSSCDSDGDCTKLECCRGKKCVESGCVYSTLVVALFSTCLIVGFIFFVVVVIYAACKIKRSCKHRRAIRPLNWQMNSTVQTMPSTWPSKNSASSTC